MLMIYSPLKATIHEILVWDGYMQFMPSNLTSVQLGDTIEWHPLDVPTMVHTVTSSNIPIGAIPFDQVWQAPADTFFQYIPIKIGLYEYVCTPHIPNGMIGSFYVEDTLISSINISLNRNPFIFPNPADDIIHFCSEFVNLEFDIYNFSGKLVLSGTSSYNFNVSKLPTGIFYMVVYAEEPEKFKFIIN
jgi:plastocyanin